jgi:hypothetical protein
VDGLGESDDVGDVDGLGESDDAGDVGLSEDVDDVPLPACADSRAASLAADLADALVLAPDPPRSFLAQPVPLKWMAGAANCLRMVDSAPHDGQKRGPGSLIP